MSRIFLVCHTLQHIKNENVSANFLFLYFFSRAIFERTLHIILLNPISKMFCNFSLKLTMTNCRQVFLVLWPRKQRNTLNKRKTKFALTCNIQKVIQALTFRSHEKFDNSLFFKMFGIA